jgi:hypothetical protein
MTWLISKALMQAYAKSRYLPEVAEEYGAENYLDGGQYAQLNVTPTQHKFWHNDKMMEPSRLSRFGLTCKVLTESHGKDLLTWYLADSHAKTSAYVVKERALQAKKADSGNTWLGSLAKYDHDTHSLKTLQCSLFEESIPSYVTLPRWGTMQNGVLLERAIPAQITNATAFGLLPTTTATDCKGRSGAGHIQRHGPKRLSDAILTPKLPTLTASDSTRGGKKVTENMTGQSLRQVIGGKLNPTWCEWFMGWPMGATELEPLAMDKYLTWLNWHGNY